MSHLVISLQVYGPHGGPLLVWAPPDAGSDISAAAANTHLARLRRRRRHVVDIEGGVEFDTYTANGVPLGCPELAAARTRVTVRHGPLIPETPGNVADEDGPTP